MLTPGIYARELVLKEFFQSLPKHEVLVDAGCGSKNARQNRSDLNACSYSRNAVYS